MAENKISENIEKLISIIDSESKIFGKTIRKIIEKKKSIDKTIEKNEKK